MQECILTKLMVYLSIGTTFLGTYVEAFIQLQTSSLLEKRKLIQELILSLPKSQYLQVSVLLFDCRYSSLVNCPEKSVAKFQRW